MRSYILKRLLFMVITLLVITIVSYTMMRLAPGDPVRSQQLGAENAGMRNASKKESLGEKILREKYHLDRNPLVGYGYWIWGIVTRFDWGDSLVVDRGAPVLGIIAERLPATLKLETLSIILIYACAIPMGIYSAVRRNTLSERGMTVGLFLLYSLPTFWVGLLMLVFCCGSGFEKIFGFKFPVAGLAPDSYLTWGASYWHILALTALHYVLPVVCLSYASLAGLSRFARVGILEIVRQDYIRTARAKGLPEWKVILKHVFRNSLLPLVTLFAGLLPGLIGGSIIVEYIFSIHGMGSLSILALSSRDYTLMMALFTIGAVLTLLGILISDLLYAAVDPRITYE